VLPQAAVARTVLGKALGSHVAPHRRSVLGYINDEPMEEISNPSAALGSPLRMLHGWPRRC
jgi:hypothetical protein